MNDIKWSYDVITKSAADAIAELAAEPTIVEHGAQATWHMARGVMRGWSNLVGVAALAEDRHMLEALIEDIAARPAATEPTTAADGWVDTPVVIIDEVAKT